MNRTEWKTFQSNLRRDAREFHARHGGYPMMTHRLTHNGQEWSMTRTLLDNGKWRSHLRKSVIRQRPKAERIHTELNDTATYRKAMRQRPWAMRAHKAGLEMTIRAAREIRTGAA